MASQSEAEALPGENHDPSSVREKYMAALWREIIGLEKVTLSSKFLDVGGNSLTLNIILTRIETETGAVLDPQMFFDDEQSSLFQIARQLDVVLTQQSDGSQ
jgi:hypothetical protein